MKTFLIMRHAKSSWASPEVEDYDRPLNERGERDAPRMGALLKERALIPDLMISSSAQRAKTTAGIVAENCDYSGTVRFHDHLYLGAPKDYFRSVGPVSATIDCCMVIGHNPGLEQLVEKLTDEFETMPTAAVAIIECDITDWGLLEFEGPFKLKDVWRPKEVFSL